MKQLLFFCLLPWVLLSCDDISSEESIKQDVASDSLIFASKDFTLPTLNSQASKIVENWPIFQEFKTEALGLKNLPLENLKSKTERLILQVDSISKNIPDTLRSNTIQSRVAIVKTRVNLLKQEINRGRIRPLEIEKNLEETKIAITTFILQLNEKVVKDKIDFQRKDNEEKELEKQRKTRDSIFEQERKDQNKNSL